MAGCFVLFWTVGWSRKNCGTLPLLRRRGQRVVAEVLAKDCRERTVVVAGWPVRAKVHSLHVRYDVGGQALESVVQLRQPAWMLAEEVTEVRAPPLICKGLGDRRVSMAGGAD
jgi:hypothetical protein